MIACTGQGPSCLPDHSHSHSKKAPLRVCVSSPQSVLLSPQALPWVAPVFLKMAQKAFSELGNRAQERPLAWRSTKDLPLDHCSFYLSEALPWCTWTTGNVWDLTWQATCANSRICDTDRISELFVGPHVNMLLPPFSDPTKIPCSPCNLVALFGDARDLFNNFRTACGPHLPLLAHHPQCLS